MQNRFFYNSSDNEDSVAGKKIDNRSVDNNIRKDRLFDLTALKPLITLWRDGFQSMRFVVMVKL